MRFILLLGALATACVVAPAYAGATISLYADPGRESCEVVDVYPGVVQLHLFYEGDLGAKAVAFVAPTPECWTDAVWLGDVIAEPWLPGVGDTHDEADGILVNLLGCHSGSVYLGYMSFQASGRGARCCAYEIVGSKTGGPPAVVDCNGALVAVETGDLVVNPSKGCGCVDGNIVVAVEASSWGRVKALYR
jgi:hypothetical protein